MFRLCKPLLEGSAQEWRPRGVARVSWLRRYSPWMMQSHSLACRIGSMVGQRTRKRHEDDQSDNRDDDYHDDHL